jgi:hypothetical protein
VAAGGVLNNLTIRGNFPADLLGESVAVHGALTGCGCGIRTAQRRPGDRYDRDVRGRVRQHPINICASAQNGVGTKLLQQLRAAFTIKCRNDADTVPPERRNEFGRPESPDIQHLDESRRRRFTLSLIVGVRWHAPLAVNSGAIR